MLELDVYNLDGEKADSVKIDEAIFGQTTNRPVLRQALLMYGASRRSGTACAKNRADVRGTRKKPFRQKGTGRARQGSWLSPHHVGGGVAHGPVPRDYAYSIPKKARLAALKSAYLERFRTATYVVDEINMESPKTKQIVRLLKNLNIRGTCLIATLATSEPVAKSVRNVPGVSVKRIQDVNAYDLLLPRDFLVTRRALESVLRRFADIQAEGGVK